MIEGIEIPRIVVVLYYILSFVMALIISDELDRRYISPKFKDDPVIFWTITFINFVALLYIWPIVFVCRLVVRLFQTLRGK